jgi:two-component system sensor histidine kinase/response regulator
MGPIANILVVDDEVGIRQGCSRVLQPLGYVVDLAATFSEARDKLESGHYDLVLLDVMMPDGQGVDLLEPILSRDPETVPVIITGFATVELAVEAIRRGAYNFISKPFTGDVLTMAVEQGLEKRRLSLEAKRAREFEKQAEVMTRAKEEAERLNEFKSNFVWMVAHELRAPVGGAQSLVRTMLRGLAGEVNDQQKEILSRVDARLGALLDLVNDLLTLAASKSVEAEKPLEAVALLPLVERVVDRFSDEAGIKHVDLTLSAPKKALNVQARSDGLETVLRNLVGNAVKYTPEGGRVSVEVARDGEQARVRVSDTGIGIPAEELAHVWDEFFRAQNAKQSQITGTGLGLSIVKQFVDQFGGRIEVQSHVGQGTRFDLWLNVK